MTRLIKKLVVVDPYYDFLIQQLRNDGFELFAVFSEKRETKGYFKYNPQDFVEIYNAFEDYPMTLTSLREKNIQGLLTGFDSGFKLSLRLARDLEIDDSNDIELGAILGNKFKTTEYLRNKNVAVAEHLLVNLVNNNENISLASKKIGYPLIIKPTESAGSFGFYICHTEKELENRINELLGKEDIFFNTIEEVVIEEYLQGTEYAVCSVTQHGEHVIPAIYRYEQFLIDGNNFIRSISLAEFHQPNMDAILQYAFAVLKALNYRQGQAAIEIMMTKKGPRLIEFNPRVGGLRGYLDIMVNACTGMNHIKMTSLSYHNFNKFQTYVGKPYVCKKQGKILFLRNYADGIVHSLKNIDKVRKLLSYKTLYLPVRLNDKIYRTAEIGASPGYVVLVHEDKHQIQEDIETIDQLEKEGLFS